MGNEHEFLYPKKPHQSDEAKLARENSHNMLGTDTKKLEMDVRDGEAPPQTPQEPAPPLKPANPDCTHLCQICFNQLNVKDLKDHLEQFHPNRRREPLDQIFQRIQAGEGNGRDVM